MPASGSAKSRLGLLAATFLIALAGSAMAQDKVGVSSAVNPQATGTAPGGTSRQLVIGQDVLYNEHINTGGAGQTQLLFLDESSMTVGPNSDLTIDQFVYDPKSGTGKLAMSATRGLLRYVGGKLSKQDEAVTLKTSTATLAVRGGAFIVSIGANGSTNAVFIYGNGLTVTSNSGGTQTVTRPGFQTTVNPGSPPSPPAPQPPTQLAQYLQQLDGRPGGSGGATTIPSDTSVQNSGIEGTISGNVAGNVQVSTQASAPVTGNTLNNPGNGGGPGSTQQNFVQQPSLTPGCGLSGGCAVSGGVGMNSSGQIVGNGQITNSTPPQPPPSSPSPPPPTTFTYEGRLKNTNGKGTTQGFVSQSANADIAYSSATLSYPQGVPNSGTFTGNFTSNGATSVGTLTFPLIPGSASFNGTSSALGAITGTSYLSNDDSFFYATITPVSQPTERLFVYGGTPATPANSTVFAPTGVTRILAFTVQPDAALQSNIPFVPSQAGGNLANASVSPLYVVAPPTTAIGDASTASAARALQASLAINGQGANQQSVISVTTGTFATSNFNPSNPQPIQAGLMRGTSQMSASSAPVALGSAVSSSADANGNSLFGTSSAITGYVLDQSQYVNNGNGTLGNRIIPSTASETPLSGSATTYGFAQPVLPTAVPTAVSSAGRTTQALSGSFGGLMYTTAQSTPYGVQGSALISTNATTNQVQAQLGSTAIIGASSGVNSIAMNYGGLTGTDNGGVAFVNNNTFAAMESATTPQQVNGQTLAPNGNTANGGQLYLVSSGATGQPTQLLPSGVSYCQCQYLQWGFWGGDLQTGTAAGSSPTRVDMAGINTWVAGTPTSTADLNNLTSMAAVGTYTGAAVGSVYNQGNSYLAGGGFNATYNFGTQSGNFAITNFDGHTFAASGSAPLSGANYSFSPSGNGFSGSASGTFYGPKAAETGGTFAVQSTVPGVNYIASGIFAGKQ